MESWYAIVFLGGILPFAAQADSATSAWFRPGHVLLNATDAEQGLNASWRFDRASNGDIRIVKREQRGGLSTAGSVISVCNNQALLFEGLVPHPGQETEEVDAPILLLQLTLKLLAHAVPAGPQAVTRETTFHIEDIQNPIRVHKGTASRRDFLPPWQASGLVSIRASDALGFKIHFVYKKSDGADAALNLNGDWREASEMPTLDDTFSLENWRVYRINTVLNFVAGNGHFDSIALSQPLRFQTLGALRSRIEKSWSPSLTEPKRYSCPH